MQQAFTTLNLAYNDEDSLREKPAEMSNAGEAIIRCQNDSPGFDVSPIVVNRQTAGLAAFISACLKGAKAYPGRGKQNGSYNLNAGA